MSTVATERALGLAVPFRAAKLLALPEDQWFDRKSARIEPRKVAESLVAFANAEGGTVLIGLSQGTVEGVVHRAKQVAAWQQAAIDFTVPLVRVVSRLVEIETEAGPDELLVLDVQSSDQVHATFKDEVFLRIGDENRKLTFAQRQELLYDKGQANFETTASPDASIDDLDQQLLAEYAEAVHHPDPVRLLQARGLTTRSGELTVGAVLLFAEHPQRWHPEAIVRVLRYRGTERGTGSRQQLLTDQRISGSIPAVLSEARRVIFEQVPKRRALGTDGKFSDIGLVPEDAWLEALVNAVVHRSYSNSGDHIRVEIFDDRIEVESPGRFPGVVETADLPNVARFARNHRIARVCADLDFGQELGEGVRRIFEEMRLAGLTEPTYFQTAGSVRVTLSSAAVDVELEGRLPAASREVVRMIREALRMSTGEVVQATGRSRPSVIAHLKALEKQGLIRWVGNSKRDPRAYWTVKTDVDE